MPSTLSPFRTFLLLLAVPVVAVVMYACGGDRPSAPSTSDIPSTAVVSDTGQSSATASATSDDPPLNYSENGCMGIKVAPLSFQNDGFLPSDGVFRARYVFYQASVSSGTVHLAIFKVIEGQPQQKIASEPKNFDQATGTFTITMPTAGLLEECATYQVDAGCGRNPPPDAKYRGNGLEQDFIESWRVGNRCAPVPTPEPTPDPTPTPTPICNQGGDLRFATNVLSTCGTPTPTPTPRSTPTATPTPTVTPTPTATPTGTPQATPTPTPTATPTPTPTSTPTPRPSPTPACNPLTSLPLGLLLGPFTSSSGISGNATFINTGSWDFNISATSTLAKCNARQWDYPDKVHVHKDLTCGQSHNTGGLSYPWAGHGSEYWRLTIRLNGNVYAESSCVANPYN